MATPLEALRAAPLFAELPQPDLERLCQISEAVRLEPGDALIREGEPGEQSDEEHFGPRWCSPEPPCRDTGFKKICEFAENETEEKNSDEEREWLKFSFLFRREPKAHSLLVERSA